MLLCWNVTRLSSSLSSVRIWKCWIRKLITLRHQAAGGLFMSLLMTATPDRVLHLMAISGDLCRVDPRWPPGRTMPAAKGWIIFVYISGDSTVLSQRASRLPCLLGLALLGRILILLYSTPRPSTPFSYSFLRSYFTTIEHYNFLRAI